MLEAEESNLRHALDLARVAGLWDAAVGCLQGLRVLYERTGRDSEWARLVAAITPDFTDPDTGGPLPGRENQWHIVTSYRARIARQARDWPAAIALQNNQIGWLRDQATDALAVPSASLTKGQRNRIGNLGVALGELGDILLAQEDPGCLPLFQESLTLAQRTGDRPAEAREALNLGNAYLLPGLRDLDQAERWIQHSLNLRQDDDQLGRAENFGSLGTVAMTKFQDALAAGEAEPVLMEHLNAALRGYQQALDLVPANDHENRAIVENQLGIIYRRAGDNRQALRHYQQSIQHEEVRGDVYGAGLTRYNIALLLADDGRISDALLYARAALHNYQQAGPGAASKLTQAEQLITWLEGSTR